MFRSNRWWVVMVAIMIAGWLCGGGPVAAAEPELTAEAEALLVSKYIWRGLEVNEDPVLQPSVTLGYGGFSLNLWGNLDLTDFGRDECVYTSDCESRAGQFTEIDLTLDYSHSFDKFTVGVGVIAYEFPNWEASEDTHEAYVSLAYDTLMQPTLTVYYDFDEVEGFYANFSLAHSFSINEKLSVDLSGGIGYGDSDYNAFYFGIDDGALVDVNCGITLPFRLTEKITITPQLRLASVVDSDLRDAVADKACCDNETNLYGGIAIGFSF
ncbi:MAG: MipA/OmpV family protein [Deltaproteobacteria bacterium]|nr:MipA/OmpV family protein [Deltaproteobacteria bacterium]